MNSKVKEIKKVLEEGQFNTINHHQKEGKTIKISFADILTLINELESENERWQKDCDDIANDYQEMGNFYYEEVKKNQQLKDRIAELEKEIEENAFYSKGYAEGIKNTYDVVLPDKLKQFAERLKEKMGVREYMGVKYKQGVFSENDIDETLKEFIE